MSTPFQRHKYSEAPPKQWEQDPLKCRLCNKPVGPEDELLIFKTTAVGWTDTNFNNLAHKTCATNDWEQHHE